MDRGLSRLEEFLACVLLGEAAILTFLQVVLRYFFGVTYSWIVELVNYSLIACALIGASIGVRENVHIGVDVVIKLLPQRIHRAAVVVSYIASAGFCLVVALLGIDFVTQVMSTGQRSPDLEVPMWIPYSTVPLGFGLMTLRFIQVMLGYLRGDIQTSGHQGV